MGGARMIPVSPGLAIAVAAALLLLWLVFRTLEDGGDADSGEIHRDRSLAAAYALPPAELATRIFSRSDREFILNTGSARLQRLYRSERRRLASQWVRRTSREVSRIMREHRLASRAASNLNVVTETRLFFQYLELRLLCSSLLLLIHLFGPHALADLASQTGQLYQHIGRVLDNVAPASAMNSTGNSAA
jgi:hypothetical protein